MALNFDSLVIQEKVKEINNIIIDEINNQGNFININNDNDYNNNDNDNEYKIKLLQNKIKTKYIEINNYQDMINKNKIIIKNIQKEIYQTCNHKWEYDLEGCCMYESPEIICNKCNLYKV